MAEDWFQVRKVYTFVGFCAKIGSVFSQGDHLNVFVSCVSSMHHVYQRLIAAGWKIRRTILAKKKMKDESSYMYLHRQFGMQVSSCSETVNNPYTYTCVDLYMASPLEKKQRTGSVNITQNIDCPA